MSDQELGQLLLEKLNLQDEQINSLNFAKENQIDHQKVVGAVKSLQSLGELIQADQVENKRFELTKEGEQILQNGSHEYRVWSSIPVDGAIQQSELMQMIKDPNVSKLGFAKAMSNKWISIDKSSGKPMVRRSLIDVMDDVRNFLKLIKEDFSDKVFFNE